MGMTGLFKRRRERESAIPPGTLETDSVQTAPVEEPPPPTTPPTEPPASEPPPPSGGRSIAEEVAAAVGGFHAVAHVGVFFVHVVGLGLHLLAGVFEDGIDFGFLLFG